MTNMREDTVWVCYWEGQLCVYADREALEEVFANVHDDYIEEEDGHILVDGYFEGWKIPVWRKEDDTLTNPSKPYARVKGLENLA